MRKNLYNKAQEEMVGFVLIVVILAVIILIFFGFSLANKNEEVQSYEVESYVNSLVHYTTECQDSRGRHLDIGDLIIKCDREEDCLNQTASCEVLNSTIHNMLRESWKVSENSPLRGYFFDILITGNDESRSLRGFDRVEYGNSTGSSRGAKIILPRTEIVMTAYY